MLQKGLISMPRPQLILPRADAGCGKAFCHDRRTADHYRVALEFWNRATGRIRQGYQLAVYRCKRCGGYHTGQKRIEERPVHPVPGGRHPGESYDGTEDFRVAVGFKTAHLERS
jgi:hypothetical protein